MKRLFEVLENILKGLVFIFKSNDRRLWNGGIVWFRLKERIFFNYLYRRWVEEGL